MVKQILLLLLVLTVSKLSVSQNILDCTGAKHLCSNYDTIPSPFTYSGNGSVSNEIATTTPSCYCRDTRAIWYNFTVQQSGVLRFEITADNSNTDYDWTLFNMSGNVACSTLATYTGAVSAMSRSNTWGAYGYNGPTGVSSPQGGSGTCNGPGTGNGPKWNADLSVTAGQTYVLAVQNWSGSTSGYVIDFSSSTAVIYDNVSPYMNQFTSNTTCADTNFSSITFNFNEKILCSSVSVSDFDLSGPGGNYTITSVSGTGCTSSATSAATSWTINFSPPITAAGTYVLKLTSADGFVEDLCGNLDTLDSLVFTVVEPVISQFTTVDPLCEGICTGTISTTITQGNSPFTYYWGPSIDSAANISGLCAGGYPITITDSIGCQYYDSIIINQPDPYVLTLDTVLNVSCPGSINCDGGALLTVTGNNPPYQYIWTSGETSPMSQALCSGTNWVTVTDINQCPDSISVDILVPDPILTTAFGDTQICITNLAAIGVASIGGTPPFSYVWTRDSLDGLFTDDQNITQVSPNVTRKYFVSSTDSRGCSGDTGEVIIKVRPPLDVELAETDTICPYDDITLYATGFGGDSLYSFTWSSGTFGPTATVSPDLPMWFTVTVSDYCGSPAFSDSVFVQVGGHTPIIAEIRAEDDSICVGESVYLVARGKGGFKGPEEYRFKWDFTSDTDPFQFVKPLQTTQYIVTITDLCISRPDVDTITIHVGETVLPTLKVAPETACAESEVTITINDFQPKYRYDFNMGDGKSEFNITQEKFEHVYNAAGCYDIKLNLESDFGCLAEQLYPCAVQILQKPVASFSQNPQNPSSLEPFVQFINTSSNYTEGLWSVDGETFDALNSLRYEFQNRVEDYQVRLIVRSEDGCVDTISKSMHYIIETVIYFPSSFTPNEDGKNDVFMIEGESIDLNAFDLTIFDRWGHQVFRSNNPFHGWDGTLNDGSRAPLGTYAFTLRFIDRFGNQKMINNSVTISKAGEKTGLR